MSSLTLHVEVHEGNGPHLLLVQDCPSIPSSD